MDRFEDLLGKTLQNVENTGEEIIFTLDDGTKCELYHSQDCCEYVRVEDVIGELDDLVGSPILMAEEVSGESPDGFECGDSCTWTFYKLATIKGYVTIRFLGESNGYYSESVSFRSM